MRWSIIRTIWLREMRDQLRDRRTLVMVLGLPLFLYPLLGLAFLQFTLGAGEKPSVIGVVTGSDQTKDFPSRRPPEAGRDARPWVSWLAAMPIGADVSQWTAAAALAGASHRTFDYPLFIDNGYFTVFDAKMPVAESHAIAAQARLKLRYFQQFDAQALAERDVDLILDAVPEFFHQLDVGDHAVAPERSNLFIHQRPGDERSRLALKRLMPLVQAWKNDIKKVRMARAGLTEPFLDPVEIRLPEEVARQDPQFDMVLRVFPVLLVMWSLAGAFYPAVDLCAGEKERGTMETLLITPAGREEIVLGKFLTIWILSAGTALLNLLSMGITTALFASHVSNAGVSWQGLAWCVLLSLPQSAFFSALALAIGAYARSSKEGQYYLMPLFVVTMPLAFLTMSPGIELNPLYSLIPVTGVALLMQKLATAQALGDVPWAYFVPVLAPIGLYSWLALQWAIEQFNREGVLFREAERIDLVLWLKSLFRDKEPLPTAGEAFFALGVIIGLRWLSLGLGNRWSLETHTVITQLAFVATPPLIMALLLNTKPGAGLYLRWPKGREAILAALLALLMLPPMIGLTQAIIWRFPTFLEGAHPLLEIMRGIQAGRDLDSSEFLSYLAAFALVPAVCEEVAFRGFILCGLHNGFRPRNAVFLSSFFFALFHLNVYLFVPTFVFGVVLGLLTIRSRSLLPAILFHFLHNTILIALMPLRHYADQVTANWAQDAWAWVIGLCLVLLVALLWWLYRKPYVDLARREAAERAAREQAADERR